MRKLLQALFVVLQCLHGLLAANDVTCLKNRTLLEVPGDAVVTVFIDINEGSYCNETTQRGLQKISTAVNVVRILNKYNYVPDMSIGLRIFDTCHDEVVVYKQAITALTALDCTINYELSILASESYSKVLRPFVNYSLLQINYYPETNFSLPLMETALHYISSKFEVIDLLLTSAIVPSNRLLHLAQQTGICVRNHENIAELEGVSEIVVFAVGYWTDVQTWFEMVNQNHKATWIVISLDDYYDYDSLPVGTYYIKSSPLDELFEDAITPLDNYLNVTRQTILHSPYLLDLGRSIVQIVKPLRLTKSRPCEGECATRPEEVAIPELYDILHIAEDSQFVRYSILKKTQDEVAKLSSFDLRHPSWRSTEVWQKMPGLCLTNSLGCEGCLNFKKDPVELDRQLLRSTEWVPIYLTIASCGTFACIIIGVFIIYRYFTDEILEGNPALTILLVLADIFLLQTVFPFCMDDDFVGPEQLNSRKIFLTTLSFGLLFSIILSRALFLAFTTGNMLTSHINGYLQSLMIFFMAGVQVTISTMYFLLNTSDSATVVRSLTFIALLSYDIFLLVVLFVICCFIAQVQRNYREGKCFFGTVIGLLVVWAIWLTCFVLVEPEVRDIIVCFGIVATGVFVIIGILIPRTYYMVTHLRRDSIVGRRFNPTDFVVDPRMNTTARQYQQPFYEYIRPVEEMTGFSTLPVESCSNYYGTSSPSSRYFDRTRLSEPRAAYNNYGFHSEMRELENAYVVPRVCVENPEGFKTQLSNSDANGSRAHRQPRKPKLLLREKDCIETDIYVEDKSISPTRRGPNENYPSRCSSPKLEHVDATIREEDEFEESFLSRTTKF